MIGKSQSSLSDTEALHGASSIWNAKNITFLGLIFQAFNFVVGVSALPLRLFLRKNLGERSIRPGAFLLSIVLHIYYFTIFDIFIVIAGVVITSGDNISLKQGIILSLFVLFNPYFIFLVLVIRKGVLHFKQKVHQAKNNEIGYSYYRGESKYFSDREGNRLFGFTANDTIIRMLVEPRAVIKYGIVLFLFCLAVVLYMVVIVETKAGYIIAFLVSLACTGLVFAFDGICLFLEEFSLFMTKRDKALDILDGQQDMGEIMEQKVRIEKGRMDNQQNNNYLKPDNPEEDEDVSL